MSLAGSLHLLLHILVPFCLARGLAGSHWRKAFALMLATWLVDLDHLLATPLYDPERCSIAVHPLHRWFVWPLYLLMSLWPKSRWLGIGLLVHMALDGSDCLRQRG